MIACLEGYLNRNTDPEPGPITLRLRLCRLRDSLIAEQALDDINTDTYV